MLKSNNLARIAIHGGAGVIDRATFGGAREQRYRSALSDIVSSTWQKIESGSDALTAAEYAVSLLENCAFFNAGHGAVLNRDGHVEMDAAIMNGRDRNCGAVASVNNPRNPIQLARKVMEQTEHVLLAGPAADQFAAEIDHPCEPLDYFVTQERLEQLRAAAQSGRISLDHDEKYGTVGAVVRDSQGNLAAATSTGGMTNKTPGRVGDSPLIGSGTWADNNTCAISGTGHGEYFIRAVLAYDVHSRMAYQNKSIQDAAQMALNTVADLGGSGGLIGIDCDGNICLAFNSPGMYRGWIGADQNLSVAIYDDE